MNTQKSEDPEHFEHIFTDLHMRQLLTELTANPSNCFHNVEFSARFKAVCDNLTSEVCFDLWKKPDFCPEGSYQYISLFPIVIEEDLWHANNCLNFMLEKLEPQHLKEAITSPHLKILHLAMASSNWDAANLIIMHINARLESSKFECINVEDDEGKSVIDHAISSKVPPSTLNAIIEAISNTDEFYKHLIVKGPMIGNTPLHNAMENGYLHLATKLATVLKPEQLFALLEIQNKQGKTPLDIAEQKCPTYQAALFSTRQLMASILRSHVSNLIQSEPQPELNGKPYSHNYITYCIGDFNTTSSPQPKSFLSLSKCCIIIHKAYMYSKMYMHCT